MLRGFLFNLGSPRNANDTDAGETPASFATSRIVTTTAFLLYFQRFDTY